MSLCFYHVQTQGKVAVWFCETYSYILIFHVQSHCIFRLEMGLFPAHLICSNQDEPLLVVTLSEMQHLRAVELQYLIWSI